MDSALDKLWKAVDDSDIDAVRLLIQQGDCLQDAEFGTCAFFYDYTNLEIIRLLAEAGADINAINDFGEWPLLNAAAQGNPETVAYLLSMGAKPNLSSTGETAIHKGVFFDHIEVVRLLLAAGADPNATDGDGWTCLMWLKSLEMTNLLLASGADPSVYRWRVPAELEDLPENHEPIPEAVRDLLRAHRLKNI